MRIFKQGWLKAYKEYVLEHESPAEFHLWVSIQMVSGALRRCVWIDRGAYKIHPNMYVILISRSASCRKSVAMETGMNLLREVSEATILYERASLEGLMDRMCRMRVVQTPQGPRAVPDGSIFIHADEMSDFFGKSAYLTDLISFMTASYSKSRVEFLTRTKGLCSISNACPCLLTGTTPEQIPEVFPSITLVSGFLGRVIFVTGLRGKRVRKPKLNKKMRDDLVHDLQEIAKLEGEFTVEPEADEYFGDWYESLPDIPPQGVLPAFYERKHDHVLKVALVLSASESDDKVITLDHIGRALEIIERVQADMEIALEYVGATIQGQKADIILSIVSSAGKPITHSELMRKAHRRVGGASEFKDLVDVLVQSGQIEMTSTSKGIVYSIKGGTKKP